MYYEMIDSLQNLTLDGADGCCFVFQIFFIKAFSNVCMYYEMIDSLQNLTLDGADGCCFVFQIFFIKAFSNVCMYVLVP